MIQETLTIPNPTGLHTRPAKNVVAEAKKYESEIVISYNEKEASAKSLLKLMKLGISQNAEITLTCDGSDEADAAAALKSFIENLED
ncbi:MAG: HPr family phosphocarrier protein [Spirochaetales bacterium]|nr:HPr family phosphocarrier protein [Spirochaetales bacterium]